MTESDIISILNKYETTDPRWVEDFHKTKVIDPMDFHKIAKEIMQITIDNQEFKNPTK